MAAVMAGGTDDSQLKGAADKTMEAVTVTVVETATATKRPW
jgi:hypothetical protein